MRAAVLLNYKEPLIIDTSISKPEPLADDVLVKIKVAGINPADYKFARGDLKMVFGMTFPAILGMDFSGIIEAVGSDVTDFKIGDAVYGNITPREVTQRGGSYSEYMLADTKKAIILKKPETISFEDSASLPIVALTAYTGLVIQGQIDQSPKNVIIAGASGGVGAIAVQIAKKLNCQVTAVCSGANAEFVKSLGADTVVDYTKGILDELFIYRHVYDVMLDCVGGNDYWELAQKILKPDGIFSSATGPVVDVPVSARAIFSTVSSIAWRKVAYSQSYRIIMNPSKMPDELINWIKDGSFKSIISQKFKLEEMEKAHDLSRSHRTRGKSILIISDDLIQF